MENPIFFEQTFENATFYKKDLLEAEFEQCQFINCMFPDSDLSHVRFIECDFDQIDLSNCKIFKTSFQECTFITCKLMGLSFDQCDMFGLNFKAQDCIFDHASFYQVKLPGFQGEKCSFRSVDFTEAILKGANFNGSDFNNAIFERTELQKADLLNTTNLYLDPENNLIKEVRINLEALPGLLTKFSLHIKQ